MSERVEGDRPNVPRGHDAAVLERLTVAQLAEIDALAAEGVASLAGLSQAGQAAALRQVVAEIDARIDVMLGD